MRAGISDDEDDDEAVFLASISYKFSIFSQILLFFLSLSFERRKDVRVNRGDRYRAVAIPYSQQEFTEACRRKRESLVARGSRRSEIEEERDGDDDVDVPSF